MSVDFTIDYFRGSFPEFANMTKYPDSMINFWSSLASSFLNKERWGDQLIYGICLLVAHNITLQAIDIDDVSSGGDPGRSSSVVASEGAGGVNVSFDTSASIEEGAGHYNETRYGKMFIRTARLLGAGASFV